MAETRTTLALQAIVKHMKGSKNDPSRSIIVTISMGSTLSSSAPWNWIEPYEYSNSPMAREIEYITSLGGLVISAAGNGRRVKGHTERKFEREIDFPGGFPTVIAVGARLPNGNQYEKQSYGPAHIRHSESTEHAWVKPDVQGITEMCAACNVCHPPYH